MLLQKKNKLLIYIPFVLYISDKGHPKTLAGASLGILPSRIFRRAMMDLQG